MLTVLFCSCMMLHSGSCEGVASVMCWLGIVHSLSVLGISLTAQENTISLICCPFTCSHNYTNISTNNNTCIIAVTGLICYCLHFL